VFRHVSWCILRSQRLNSLYHIFVGTFAYALLLDALVLWWDPFAGFVFLVLMSGWAKRVVAYYHFIFLVASSVLLLFD